jgi:GT2 family glycosyltransferase
MPALAIVIPAYKPDFFRATLDSLAAQSDRRFRVYVGDDAGPPQIEEIVSSYEVSGIDLVYHRFEDNLGGRSLTAHWNRCVRLSTEPWVWLFADYDVMEPDCVACFHREAALAGERDLIRFDTTVIGAQGEVLAENPSHPAFESGVDFVFDRLQGRRNSYVVEYVFPRESFERAGGFPDYPVAWCADDAAWYLFSQGGRIHTLPGAKVRWRASGRNITDAKRRNQHEKLIAGARFLEFVDSEVRPNDDGGRGTAAWRDAAENWYVDQVCYLMPIAPRLWGDVLRLSDGVWHVRTARKLTTLAVGSAGALLRILRGAVTHRVRALTRRRPRLPDPTS